MSPDAHTRNMILYAQPENMDLSSSTEFCRGSETYLNTQRNRNSAGRIPSSSSMFSFSFSSPFSSDLAHASSDSPLPSSKQKKVRFAYPVVTAVFEHKPKPDEKRVRFAVPLTNIPLRSKEERVGLRLPGTCYDTNTGPICDDRSRHYNGMCVCDQIELEEYAESPDEDAEPATFRYHGPLFHDDDDGMFQQPAQDACEEAEYGLAI
ncbi:hypothetical protein PMIN04_011701 [Paraphaeosphaeria minitans]|uniref:Uncharacterized protein n=1 Tax=Paraphaeosphaeria minitans TaxID=565426 RepID=A0A9P6KTA8_9PLEO|nr:hypothetical protein PMIN01_05520 [Paraphaeosphaeria minitans]